jgi:hypothetical protein
MDEHAPMLTVVLSDAVGAVPVKQTVACCVGQGWRAVVSAPGDAAAAVKDATEEFVHLTGPGIIFLPGFAACLLSQLEHSGKDFAVCGLLTFAGGKESILDGSGEVRPAQMVVRRWVLKELGVPKQDFSAFCRRIASEYKGARVPHVLCVEPMV